MATTTAEAFDEARALEGPLSSKLAHYAQALRALSSPFADAYDRLVQRLVAGEVATTAPATGQAMPSFLLLSEAGRLVHSAELFANRRTVVSFNRGHWCPFCRLELSTLAKSASQIAARDGQVVSITPEPAPLLGKLRVDTGAPFTFLSDHDNAYALELGLVMRVDDNLRDLMVGRGLDLSRFHDNDQWFLPIPATFVVDRDGIVRARYVDPDFRTRMAIEHILSALER